MSHITKKRDNSPIAPVLVRSKNYHWPGLDADPEYKYSRGGNPTRSELEKALAGLEKHSETLHAAAFASGLGAESAFFLTLMPGDRVLLCDEIYGGTYRLFHQFLGRFDIHCDFADLNDVEAAKKKITDKTKYIFVEPVSNPSLNITDLKKVARLSEETGVPFVVDATFSPPPALYAFEYGATAVINSLSKYYGGHADAIGGVVITKDKELHEKLRFQQSTLGATLSPDECYRFLQEIKTLPLRWERVSKTAEKVSAWLEQHPKIRKVLYPTLASHPHHELALEQFPNGLGSVISFVVNAEDHEALARFVDTIIDETDIVFGESLASPETILCYPPLMSHKSLSEEDRQALGITKGFFRISVGFEDAGKIIGQLEAGLKSI